MNEQHVELKLKVSAQLNMGIEKWSSELGISKDEAMLKALGMMAVAMFARRNGGQVGVYDPEKKEFTCVTGFKKPIKPKAAGAL